MLTEERYGKIIALLEEKKSLTVAEITELLGISESTARRDITALDRAGRLVKVFGGAVMADGSYVTHEPTVAQKTDVQKQEKKMIARAAASLVTDSDFIYIDAGTTTGCMISFLAQKKAVFVTNAVSHAQRLAAQGNKVFLVGGELKGTTEAVIGAQAMEYLTRYHFTKGFFGANGITKSAGFTTPDAVEAQVKRTAMKQCGKCYLLCDSTKFGNTSAVTFASYGAGMVMTEKAVEGFPEEDGIFICGGTSGQ